MAGVGAMFTGLRVAGAEGDGFRARSTLAMSQSGILQQSGCGARTALGRCLSAVSFEEIPFSYGPGPTRSGGIVVMSWWSSGGNRCWA
jgi:hypothetical protein